MWQGILLSYADRLRCEGCIFNKNYYSMKRLEFLNKLFGAAAMMLLPLGLINPVEEKKKTSLLKFGIRGFQYYRGPDLIHSMRKGDKLTIVREPDNKFDKNAIALYYQNQKIGFVPREKNAVLSRLLDSGRLDLSSEILELRNDDVSWDEVSAVIFIPASVNLAA
ncbi:MAG: hypothetical protein EYC69_01325 [Bacteroidetes bacterium]|nr:MAG: hypothetical protein EYC69_01325 [Bacteroidota bacterium]